ncbi:MAG: tRNA (adenosine(37)-N6)-threonylcarbamoyltransferase complex ATPase subunit type 1 TsaE [Candidatus Liptonbacteria bacterium GWB1_49_6]|uniref:tRNA threonylcarbamoyladenosine biosynthesis protein TsaE n=1 Tax=Candidatus Liptonbacteria bacterium GWB1_49_6 TaxID=1798644 RepID=A0A1G2C7S7_9BACT|nr:MAG: tRNA (adenosine(37)-N6)-threonylcarbamoyltransferase complex ATPase subunit type 1 TsaE [Candidatus Liptonbacteria bacterium GWB1_49_6]
MDIFRSSSSAATKRFAEKFAKTATRSRVPRKGALVIALSGELGSGKTTFAQGFLRGLGIVKRTTSPTFIIFRRYAIRHLQFAEVYHVDAYRLRSPREILALGFQEMLRNPRAIILVEWPERIRGILPRGILRIRFSHGRESRERRILAPVF